MIKASGRFTILVVEDNPADVYLLRQALTQAGVNHELKVIDDGAEALEFVRNHTPTEMENFDLAILDLNLPTNNGIEVLAGIRQNRALADLLVVVLTSSANPLERRDRTTTPPSRRCGDGRPFSPTASRWPGGRPRPGP